MTNKFSFSKALKLFAVLTLTVATAVCAIACSPKTPDKPAAPTTDKNFATYFFTYENKLESGTYTFTIMNTLETYTDGTYKLNTTAEMNVDNSYSAGTITAITFGTYTKALSDPDESDTVYTYNLAVPTRILFIDNYNWSAETTKVIDTADSSTYPEGVTDAAGATAKILANPNAVWTFRPINEAAVAQVDEAMLTVSGVIAASQVQS